MRLCRDLIILLLAVAFAACGDSPTGTRTPVVTTITVSGEDSLHVGESASYTASVRDQDGQVMSKTVLWSTSSSAIATIDANGKLTAVSVGTVTVRASAEDVTGTLEVTIADAPSLVATEDTITLTALNGVATIEASVDGAPVAVTLLRIAEIRWNANRGVITTSGENVVATGAGTALVEVRAASGAARPDTVVVIVQPETPYVASLTTNADTVIVAGYGLGDLGAADFTADGDAAQHFAVLDSATVLVTFPKVSSAACGVTQSLLSVDGAETTGASLLFPRADSNAILLAVGEAVRITNPSCLRLAPGARYALAAYDSQFVNLTDVNKSLGKEQKPRVTFRVRDYTAAAAGSVAMSFNAVFFAMGDENDPGFCFEDPEDWRCDEDLLNLGDVVRHRDSQETNQLVHILRLIDGGIVLGVRPENLSAISTAELDFVESVFDGMQSDFYVRMEGIFGARPSAQNGQYLVILSPSKGQQSTGGGTAILEAIKIQLPAPLNATALRSVLVHEVAHSFNSAFLRRTVKETGNGPWSEAWNTEGLADLSRWRDYTARTGFQFGRNEGSSALGFGAQAGYIERGYQFAADLLWDWSWRVAEKTGMSREAAIDSVMLYTANNRFGCTYSDGCDAYQGIYDAMKRWMGAGWSPTEATLDYRLSGPADDVVSSAIHRVPDAYRVWDDALVAMPVVTAGSGGSAEQTNIVGSTFVFELKAPNGGAFVLETENGEGAWKILRLQ